MYFSIDLPSPGSIFFHYWLILFNFIEFNNWFTLHWQLGPLFATFRPSLLVMLRATVIILAIEADLALLCLIHPIDLELADLLLNFFIVLKCSMDLTSNGLVQRFHVALVILNRLFNLIWSLPINLKFVIHFLLFMVEVFEHFCIFFNGLYHVLPLQIGR